MRPWMNKSLSFGILGLFLIALGGVLCFLWPTVFHQILQKELALSPTSKSFEIWRDTSKFPPMILKIYLFNWTNPHELYVRKPHFTQLGPYSFREVRQKDNIKFHHENKTVSYFQRRYWYFDAEHTNGSLSDIVTNLDPVVASAVHKIRYWEAEWQNSLSILLTTTGRRVHNSKTVNEMLFAGYSDNLLTMSKMMPVDDVPTYDRFGWLYMKNGSIEMDGHLNMETGEEDISQLGILRKWNYKDRTRYFKSPCNDIEGSAGEFWPPNRTKDDISIFSVDICRPIIYEYEETVSYLGIGAYRYTLDKKTLGNDTRRRFPHEQVKFFEPTTTTEDFFAAEHSAEMGFTTTTESASDERSSEKSSDDYPDDNPDIINMGHCYCNGECTPLGLVNTTSCRYGAPVFISLPHFYKSDPVLLDQVDGMSPNDKDHSFSITLEPTTGIPLEVAARLQINLLLHPSKHVSLYRDVPKIYMPMFWFDLKVQVNEEMASNLKKLLALPTVMLSTGIAMIVVGICLIGIIAFLYLKKKRRTSLRTAAPEKTVDEPSEKKSEVLYMDKTGSNEESNVRTDRRLYAKLY
ncbi:hypothetical protein P5V15_001780 [Pogonomyrmex californicus]